MDVRGRGREEPRITPGGLDLKNKVDFSTLD